MPVVKILEHHEAGKRKVPDDGIAPNAPAGDILDGLSYLFEISLRRVIFGENSGTD